MKKRIDEIIAAILEWMVKIAMGGMLVSIVVVILMFACALAGILAHPPHCCNQTQGWFVLVA